MGKVIGTIGKVLVSPIATLFGAFDDKPKPPEAKPAEKVMPMADDEAVKRAQKRSMLLQSQRGGRSGTILTSDTGTGMSSTLGG